MVSRTALLRACLVALLLWSVAPEALAEPAPPPTAPAPADSAAAQPEEAIAVTVIATIAAVAAIIGGGYALYTWLKDNAAKSVVGQLCYPPDGHPSAAWSKEDSGLDYATTRLTLAEVAADPCGEATSYAWADDVWGDEGADDVKVDVTASAEPCSGPATNQVSAAASAKADDFEVTGQALAAHLEDAGDLVMERKVEIDSLVMRASASSGLGGGDGASAVFVAIHEYDGVPDTVFYATVTWGPGGVVTTGDLTPADIDFAGFSPTEGWILKILDFTWADTITFSASKAPGVLAVPESTEVHAEVTANAVSSAPGPSTEITEMRVGQPGPDWSEYVEFHSLPGALLDTLTYLVLSDDPLYGRGTILSVVPLAGQQVPEDGYFLMAEETFEVGLFGVLPDFVPPGPDPLMFEDGVGATHMLVSHFDGLPGMDLDPDDDGNLDFRPWRETVDCVTLRYGEPMVSEVGYCGRKADRDTLQQIWLNCDGTTWMVGAQTPPKDDTPGAANPCLPVHVAPHAPAAGALLARLAPNPTTGALSFVLRLPRAAQVRLRIFDVAGRPVEEVARRGYGPGEHTLTWQPSRSRPPLASGVYYLVLESSLGRESRTFVVAR
jgi:hypothetical protein